MACFESAQALADALYCRGERPINAERVAKLVRHVGSRDDLEAVIACLPEDVRETVRALGDTPLRKKGL